MSVRTSDKRGAGTDADISIILMGANGNSPELKLESSSNDFERNEVRPCCRRYTSKSRSPCTGC